MCKLLKDLGVGLLILLGVGCCYALIDLALAHHEYLQSIKVIEENS